MELEGGHGRNRLREGGQAVDGIRPGGNVVFEVGLAEAGGEAEDAFFGNRHADANDLLPLAFGLDCLFDAPRLVRGPLLGAEQGGQEKNDGPPHSV